MSPDVSVRNDHRSTSRHSCSHTAERAQRVQCCSYAQRGKPMRMASREAHVNTACGTCTKVKCFSGSVVSRLQGEGTGAWLRGEGTEAWHRGGGVREHRMRHMYEDVVLVGVLGEHGFMGSAREHGMRHVHEDEVLVGVRGERLGGHHAAVSEVAPPRVPHPRMQEPLLALRRMRMLPSAPVRSRLAAAPLKMH